MPPIAQNVPKVVSALERFSVPSARIISGLPQLGQRLASDGVVAPQNGHGSLIGARSATASTAEGSGFSCGAGATGASTVGAACSDGTSIADPSAAGRAPCCCSTQAKP